MTATAHQPEQALSAGHRAARVFVRVCDITTTVFAGLGAVALVGMMVLIVANVITRRLGDPIQATPQLGGYAFLGLTMFCGAYALRKGMMARVPLGLLRMRGLLRQVVTLVIYAVSLAAVVVMIFNCWETALLSYHQGQLGIDVIVIPNWWMETIPVIGLIALAVQLLGSAVYYIVEHEDRLLSQEENSQWG